MHALHMDKVMTIIIYKNFAKIELIAYNNINPRMLWMV